MSAVAGASQRRPRLGARAGWTVPDRLAWIALIALLVGGGLFLLRETRGTTFWFDEWEWVLERRGGGVDTFLEPHNEHLSIVPVAIYKLLFATAGLSDYLPYRVVGIAGHLVCVVLLFAYVRRRVGEALALLAATLLLLLGPAWQNILWPFQIGYSVSLAAGVAALLLLDRRDRLGNAGACGLLALALASSGLGVPIAIGLAVDVLWGRRRWRDAWVVAGPVALYLLWSLGYQDTGVARNAFAAAPGFAADAVAAVMSALAGLASPGIERSSETLEWGRPLAVVAAAVVVWRVAGQRPVPARVLALLAIVGSFWLLTGVRRAGVGGPDSSRYLYVGSLFVLLLAAELARGLTLSRRAGVVLAAAAALVLLANLGDMREGGRYLRSQGLLARAELGALELARPVVPAGYVETTFPGHPFISVTAGPYFAAADELGSPAATPAQIASDPEDVRRAVDAELVGIHRVELVPAPDDATTGARPAVDAIAGGDARSDGGCVTFRPAPAAPAAVTPELQLTVAGSGLLLTAKGGAATVALRRFADGFPSEPLGRLAPGGSGVLRIGRDGSTRPWHARVAPDRGVTACGLP